MTKRLQGIIIGFVLAAVLLGGTAFAAVRNELITVTYRNINLSINGLETVPHDAYGNVVEPFIFDGTTFLPIRGIANALGLNVNWNDDTSTVYLNRPEPGLYGLTVFWGQSPIAQRVHIAENCRTFGLIPHMGSINQAAEAGRFGWCLVCSYDLEERFPILHLYEVNDEG